MQNVLRLIHHLATRTQRPLSTDEQLLHRFFGGHDERAFTEILERHGPMVYSVCLRVLAHHQDAEDTFQATFLTLVRKGQSIRRPGALPVWLHRVAFRLACSQRVRLRRHPVEPLSDHVPVESANDTAEQELKAALDTEVQRLPAKYRTVLILCGLQGKTYDQAARELGCPKGTVAIRLLRGRNLLKRRLAARGLIAAAGGLGAAGVVPGALAAATTSAAVAVACGAALGAVAPAGVVALIDAAARDVWLNKCKGVAVVLALLGMTGSGASVAAQAQQQALWPAALTTAPPAHRADAPAQRAAQSYRPGTWRSADGKFIVNWQPATMPPADQKPK